MSGVQYTQDTKLSLMNSSLIFTNKNVVKIGRASCRERV